MTKANSFPFLHFIVFQRIIPKLIVFFFAMLLISNACAQQPVKAQVLIIGTVHTGNQRFNHKTLFQELVKLNPDVILWEQSIPFKRVFGLMTAKFLGIAKPGIEQLALQLYSRHNATCQILPYDTAIVRKPYIATLQQNTAALHNKLHAAMTDGSMSKEDSLQYHDYILLDNSYWTRLDTSSLQFLNHPVTVDASIQLMKADQSVISDLARKYLSDTDLVQWHHDEQVFKERRNQYMAERIRYYGNRFPGKKIIVLTGLSHKHYLEEALRKSAETDRYVVTDFY